jgi:hypothetical protein
VFYPCPPPQPSDLIEDLDYVQTMVSVGGCVDPSGASASGRTWWVFEDPQCSTPAARGTPL